MKTRDLLAIHVMRAVTAAHPELLKKQLINDGSAVDTVLDIFDEAKTKISQRYPEADHAFADD